MFTSACSPQFPAFYVSRCEVYDTYDCMHRRYGACVRAVTDMRNERDISDGQRPHPCILISMVFCMTAFITAADACECRPPVRPVVPGQPDGTPRLTRLLPGTILQRKR